MGKRGGGREGKSNRACVRELRTPREWAQSVPGVSRNERSLLAKTTRGRSADRLTLAVRNRKKEDLTWAGLPYHIWKERQKICDR